MGDISPWWPRQSTLRPVPVREYYRRLATGVSIVTACGASGWSGTTVSTVTSVSLDPPILLCCIANGSRTLEAIRHARCFAVHLLADDQPELADRFSRPPSDSSRFSELGREVRLMRGSPVVEGALAVGWCDLHAAHLVGDHTVVYGRLAATLAGTGLPLLWHDRAYQTLDRDVEGVLA